MPRARAGRILTVLTWSSGGSITNRYSAACESQAVAVATWQYRELTPASDEQRGRPCLSCSQNWKPNLMDAQASNLVRGQANSLSVGGSVLVVTFGERLVKCDRRKSRTRRCGIRSLGFELVFDARDEEFYALLVQRGESFDGMRQC